MKTPTEVLDNCKRSVKREWVIAFGSALFIGLLIHLPAMLSDIPNHDGLDSLYFDQNMITSGRWFLTVACGASSYYTLPWVIGLIGLFWLGIAAAALTELLELTNPLVIGLSAGLLVSFPALASTFAYVFTLDGYMLALCLSIFSVLLTARYKWGFLPGAFCLAFSMGTYQAYLAFAILLCLYQLLVLALSEGELKGKVQQALRYAAMGVFGVALYYSILQILLLLEGKELASYQGISGMTTAAGGSILSSLKSCYSDFASFVLAGNILTDNLYSQVAFGLLLVLALYVLWGSLRGTWLWRLLKLLAIALIALLCVPVATNVILIISPEVNYHLLMRYQYVLFPLLLLAFLARYGGGVFDGRRGAPLAGWVLVLSGFVLVFNYGLMDNIGYSNLEKRYEKTYAYCLRLLDRIEQTDGYYQGIPIAIVGVVGDEQYPSTDLTGEVTGNMIGLSGDMLLYRPENYEAFIKNYLGATLNFLGVEEVADIYYSEEYIAMDTFPGADSCKVIDGVLCVKTENSNRD